MLEVITFGLFTGGLILCIVLKFSIVFPMFFGLLVFFGYGLMKKYSFGDLFRMSLKGLKTIKTLLLVFIMVGALTAVWRAAGTIPFVIYHATKLMSPQTFLLTCFAICAVISVLTGTSLGTAATMGAICMMMGNAMGQNPLWVGGAILSGAFFGDRCSPMSTSALLVSQVTKTDIYKNIVLMVKTCLVPLGITCLVYLLAGVFSGGQRAASGAVKIFNENFNLMWLTILPAAAIVILSLFRADVKITMTVSVVFGIIVCLAVQKMGLAELLKTLVFGFKTDNPQLASMMNGGGLVSMLPSVAIVGISACYTGLFQETGLLTGVKNAILKISKKITPFGGLVVTSVFTSAIGCNQTLAIMLTEQLCDEVVPDKYERAIGIENTAVVISALIPWSIAGAVPLAASGAGMDSLLAAVYLFALPLWNWAVAVKKQRASARAST